MHARMPWRRIQGTETNSFFKDDPPSLIGYVWYFKKKSTTRMSADVIGEHVDLGEDEEGMTKMSWQLMCVWSQPFQRNDQFWKMMLTIQRRSAMMLTRWWHMLCTARGSTFWRTRSDKRHTRRWRSQGCKCSARYSNLRWHSTPRVAGRCKVPLQKVVSYFWKSVTSYCV